ncbi:cytochrome P450 [Actinophytocola gossypii]|uniref:Cytochrome P450 n=1 Tax=Actinophytocola gossypii TaxID=2812003 RepID=A0ABT2JG16_9PSEU|nr:cytochrome P450 [Actinophytocola gossypii]MCT2586806.1 cytochrome P450 [Actinophytocola gossypii]
MSAPVTSPLEAFEALATSAGRRDPYPGYEAIRAHGNLVRLKPGRLVAVGHAECARALREPKLLVQDGDSYDITFPSWRTHSSLRAFTSSMLYSNPPAHHRLRGLVNGAFTPPKVAQLRSVIEDMVDRLVDHVADAGAGGSPVDLIAEFAARLPIAVISTMLGFPERDQVWFRDIASTVAESTDGFTDPAALARADAAMDELSAYFADLLDQRRRAPADDLVTMLAQVHDAGDGRLSHDELMGNLMVLLTAGFETTSFLIGHGVLLALDDQRHAHRLRTEPDFAAGYVEEILRFEPPVHITSRWAATDVDLVGTPVPAGTKLVLVLAAGNRDPRRYVEPDTFDPDRRNSQPLSFGAGGHFCLGAPLARLEARIALPTLLRRFPRLAIGGPIQYRHRLVVRGLDALPITIG